jgi:hypothetical protein
MNMEIALNPDPDPDIQRAFDWLMSFLQPGEWDNRKSAIEKHLEAILKPMPRTSEIAPLRRLVGTEDRIGWYLYLVETSQHEPYRTEFHQASRVLPVFKRLGAELDQLLKIGGIESQATKILGVSKGQPDSVLFEMLVALLWIRNGWKNVAFIPPSATEKRPDIRAESDGEEWFVETKRMATSSEYSLKEREKWLRMWGRFNRCLIQNRYPFILDISFHVELEFLDDDFLVSQLEKKLKLVIGPCKLISNETWDVDIRFVNLQKIAAHLEKQYVKNPSRQLQELIGGSWERSKGFTFVMLSSSVRIGGDRGVNEYIEDISWAAGAYWHCDAERAIESKARDIRRHLSDAVDQLPSKGRGVVHVGIETFDGEYVEAERYARIIDTVATFNAKEKNLRWIYIHLYESYSPPTMSWFFDETIYKFGPDEAVANEPISSHYTVVPDKDGGIPSAHWLRNPP